MHPFALSRVDDAEQAIAAHSQDPHLAFIAGGTDLIGLIKDRATLPERPTPAPLAPAGMPR